MEHCHFLYLPFHKLNFHSCNTLLKIVSLLPTDGYFFLVQHRELIGFIEIHRPANFLTLPFGNIDVLIQTIYFMLFYFI